MPRDHRGDPPKPPTTHHDPPPHFEPGFGDVFADHRDHGIKHIFCLMLENRSFDHMLGFSGITGTDAKTGKPTTINGLTGTESNAFEGQRYKVSTGAADVMPNGPGHGFVDVLEQMCGPRATYPKGGAYPPIDNSGYVSSYAKHKGTASPGDVMKCFDPTQLPVLTALAREFAVCDHWFSSMPGPTEPNRMYVHAGTCGTYDDSPGAFEQFATAILPASGFRFEHGTIYSRLKQAGVKYRIYADDHFPNVAELEDISVVFDITEFEEFAEHLQRPGYDAGYTFIEPWYDVATNGHFADGNSQHPRGSVAAGERLIKATYEAIRRSPVWDHSVLIITWDEHGGFYDHAVPGQAEPTGGTGRNHGFTFKQLGPRVPAVVVSPLIPRNIIEHRPFDHCAIPATVERVFKLPAMLQRDARGNGVNHLCTLPTARKDAPMTLPSVAGATAATVRRSFAGASARDPGALIATGSAGSPMTATLHSGLVQHLQVAPAAEHAAIIASVKAIRTQGDALAYLKKVQGLVHAKRVQAGLVPA